ncbi:MAG: prolyl oligopeptidase family serine peptidase [Gemmatimonadota bacterium]
MPLPGSTAGTSLQRFFRGAVVPPALTLAFWPMVLTAQSLTYPHTRQAATTDTLHGVEVADPYRWLEELNSAETGEWVASQNRVTGGYLTSLPERDAFKNRLTALWNYPRVTLPTRLANGVLFYRRNSGLQKQFVVLARSSPGTPAKLILDPNVLSPDGSTALSAFEPSPDGRHIAYALSEGGADWQDVKIRQVRGGVDLEETLRWVRFSGLSWTRDGKGFFYSRFPAVTGDDKLSAALEHQSLYYHRLGTPQDQDVLVYARPDLPTWFVSGGVSEDGRYLFVYISRGADARNRLYVADLGDPKAPDVSAKPRAIVEEDDGEFSVIGNKGSTVYLRTDLDAPRRRVVAVTLEHPERARWRTVIPQGPHTIDDVQLTRSHFVVSRLVDVRGELSLYTIDGKAAGSVALPGIGSVAGVSASQDFSGFYYAFTSPLYPSTVFRYDVATHRSTTFDPPELQFDPSLYETRQLFATSKDGTRVPFFVTHRKGLALDGANPTILYAYGGFAVTLVPTFSTAAVAWMEQGGVWVTASLRGGGEYGEAWHQAGMREHKQNVFDDYIAVAERLVADRYTSAAHLAIQGGSNGGLLVGAAMTQHPELFAVALPAVGVLDMLRYHKFTGGAAWATEYGSADDAAALPWLLAYSPLHNVKPGTCYPATLITTADHDDRVVPSHSFKFAATLQAAQRCERPVLIRVETQGSHGYRPTDKLIEETADVLAFTRANTQPR